MPAGGGASPHCCMPQGIAGGGAAVGFVDSPCGARATARGTPRRPAGARRPARRAAFGAPRGSVATNASVPIPIRAPSPHKNRSSSRDPLPPCWRGGRLRRLRRGSRGRAAIPAAPWTPSSAACRCWRTSWCRGRTRGSWCSRCRRPAATRRPQRPRICCLMAMRTPWRCRSTWGRTRRGTCSGGPRAAPRRRCALRAARLPPRQRLPALPRGCPAALAPIARSHAPQQPLCVPAHAPARPAPPRSAPPPPAPPPQLHAVAPQAGHHVPGARRARAHAVRQLGDLSVALPPREAPGEARRRGFAGIEVSLSRCARASRRGAAPAEPRPAAPLPPPLRRCPAWAAAAATPRASWGPTPG
jgi:hypothetical protein